jgi:hypothetical protein
MEEKDYKHILSILVVVLVTLSLFVVVQYMQKEALKENYEKVIKEKAVLSESLYLKEKQLKECNADKLFFIDKCASDINTLSGFHDECKDKYEKLGNHVIKINGAVVKYITQADKLSIVYSDCYRLSGLYVFANEFTAINKAYSGE